MKSGFPRTGGKHEPKGASDGGSGLNITQSGAGSGTAHNPNTGSFTGPGGSGSTGKKSDSKPSK